MPNAGASSPPTRVARPILPAVAICTRRSRLHQPDRCRLAGAVGVEEAVDRAARHVDVQVPDLEALARAVLQFTDLDGVAHWTLGSRLWNPPNLCRELFVLSFVQ